MAELTAHLATSRDKATRLDVAAFVRDNLGPASVVVATAWWLVEVTRSWGGRDAPSVTVGAALVAVAVLLSRPDRVLPRRVLVLATAISVAAFVVPLIAPTGWAGAPDGALYACGAWLAVSVAGTLAARPESTTLFLTLVAASAPIEFISGWLGWWGGKDPAAAMVGTFYWYNPYAAFLVPGGLIGLGFWIWRERLFALLGLLCFAFAAIGIVYSTSRATLAVFVAGFVLVGLTVLVGQRRWRDLRQLVIAAVFAAGATFFVGGPPFFPHRSSPVAGEQARAAGQSLGQNGGYRIDFWREALTVFRRHPLAGGGYKSMVHQSLGHVPKDWPLTPYAHDGYLQALSDGGLVLGVPFLLAVAVVAVLVVRTLYRGLVCRQLPAESVVIAIALAAVMVHSAVDFDWTYAANFAMFAILVGLIAGGALGSLQRPDPPKHGQLVRLALIGCLLIGVGTLGVSAWVQRDGNHTVNLPVPNLRSAL